MFFSRRGQAALLLQSQGLPPSGRYSSFVCTCKSTMARLGTWLGLPPLTHHQQWPHAAWAWPKSTNPLNNINISEKDIFNSDLFPCSWEVSPLTMAWLLRLLALWFSPCFSQAVLFLFRFPHFPSLALIPDVITDTCLQSTGLCCLPPQTGQQCWDSPRDACQVSQRAKERINGYLLLCLHKERKKFVRRQWAS